jgi:hypothetical protein
MGPTCPSAPVAEPAITRARLMETVPIFAASVSYYGAVLNVLATSLNCAVVEDVTVTAEHVGHWTMEETHHRLG